MQAWDNFLLKLDSELGAPTVNKWLRTLKVSHFDACNLYLEAKDSFQMAWFEEHIRSKANEHLLNNNQKKITIHLSQRSTGKKGKKGSRNTKKVMDKVRQETVHTPPEFSLVFDALDPYATFEHFVFCKENLLAFKLLCDLTGYDPADHTQSTPETALATFNPLYIYGGAGTGKTHLLMACTHCFQQMGLRAVYARSETFTEHVVSAIRAGEMRQFRQAYRDIDVLIMDDVHVFSRKGATQEEFFHTFNTLHVEGKQIILSANCPPHDLELIEPRLVSRFEWGITLGLGTQSEEELAKIAHAKSNAFKYPLDERVIDYLLHTFRSGSHALCKAMEALILRSHLRRGEGKQAPPVTAAMAAHILRDLIEDEVRAEITPEFIIQTVSEHYGIRVEDILSKAQSRECVLPRQVAMHLCRQELKLPYTKIGQLFSRDHSTVMSSCRQVKKKIEKQNSDLLSSMKAISKCIKH